MTDDTATTEETELVDLWVSGTEEPGRSWGIEPTDEGAQEMSRDETEARLMEQFGTVVDHDPAMIGQTVADEERMVMNMGPQHPSTHGVLRLQIELDGE